jgi:hypothetical protein
LEFEGIDDLHEYHCELHPDAPKPGDRPSRQRTLLQHIHPDLDDFTCLAAGGPILR